MIVINATNKSLGRIATKAAILLRGKDRPDFAPNKAPNTKVKIISMDKVKITGNKLEQKTYSKYSGYPGGLKQIPMKKLHKEKPEEIFKKAVWGMLPKNKLRKIIIKNLIIER